MTTHAGTVLTLDRFAEIGWRTIKPLSNCACNIPSASEIDMGSESEVYDATGDDFFDDFKDH